jgi:hypothetical protein
MKCATCHHLLLMHSPPTEPDGKPGTCWECSCKAFSARIDPTPPMPLDTESGDDNGNPGSI